MNNAILAAWGEGGPVNPSEREAGALPASSNTIGSCASTTPLCGWHDDWSFYAPCLATRIYLHPGLLSGAEGHGLLALQLLAHCSSRRQQCATVNCTYHIC